MTLWRSLCISSVITYLRGGQAKQNHDSAYGGSCEGSRVIRPPQPAD